MTDHAWKRYFQRIIGYDLSQLKDSFLSAEEEQSILGMGDGVFPIPGGRIVVKERRIISVLPPTEEGHVGQGKKRKRAKRKPKHPIKKGT